MGRRITARARAAGVGVPAVVVPTANPDNNQHSPNENLRLGNLAAGIGIYLAVLTEPFESPGPGGREEASP